MSLAFAASAAAQPSAAPTVPTPAFPTFPDRAGGGCARQGRPPARDAHLRCRGEARARSQPDRAAKRRTRSDARPRSWRRCARRSLPTLGGMATYTRLDANRVSAGTIVPARERAQPRGGHSQAPLINARGWVQWREARDQVDVARANAADVRRTLAVATGARLPGRHHAAAPPRDGDHRPRQRESALRVHARAAPRGRRQSARRGARGAGAHDRRGQPPEPGGRALPRARGARRPRRGDGSVDATE